MKVVPAEGRAVRDPRTFRLLPPDGAEVGDHDPFWQRRLRDGDVTVVPVEEATPQPAKEA